MPGPGLIDIAHALGHLPALLSYAVLFGLVAAESAGLPVPGETSLTIASLLAARGHLTIEVVIAVAACAAIIGDNTGYLIGRKYGRRAMLAGSLWKHRRRELLDEADRVFRSHGGKIVFFARRDDVRCLGRALDSGTEPTGARHRADAHRAGLHDSLGAGDLPRDPFSAGRFARSPRSVLLRRAERRADLRWWPGAARAPLGGAYLVAAGIVLGVLSATLAIWMLFVGIEFERHPTPKP